jgi:hypothetical protein
MAAIQPIPAVQVQEHDAVGHAPHLPDPLADVLATTPAAWEG